MPTESPLKTEGGRVRSFFSNPIVGAVGTIASVLSVALAVFFYLESRATRELRFAVNPARTVVVKPGQSPRLSIILDGVPVRSDISAVQIAFWNEGSASIRPENVLEPLIIRMANNAPIIEASIRKTSRDVVKIELDQSKLSSGILTVRWNILERGDGASIQLTYRGDTSVRIRRGATIEGQESLPDWNYEGRIRFFLQLCLWLVIMFLAIFAARLIMKRYGIYSISPDVVLVITYSFLALLWLAFTLRGAGSSPIPPFGF